MTKPHSFSRPSRWLRNLQKRFLELIRPKVELHARIYFRDVQCHHRRADCIAETIGLAWKWTLRLAEKGRDAACFVIALARYAARSVNCGRRVCGREASRDVLSPTAQKEHGFVVSRLPDFSTLSGNPLEEALIDNTQSPVPDQVAFRLDFPAWLSTRTYRDRCIAEELMIGERTSHVAHCHGLTAGRISQLRRDLHDDWCWFCGELVTDRP